MPIAKTPFFTILSKRGLTYDVSPQDNGLLVEVLVSGGATAWLKWDPARIHLLLLETQRARRGRGLGSRLLSILCEAVAASNQTIELRATPCAASAQSRDDLIAWYERRGFALCDPADGAMSYAGDEEAAA